MLFQLILTIGRSLLDLIFTIGIGLSGLILTIGIGLSGLIAYELMDCFARRYLAFNSNDHTPVYTPGSSSAPVLVCVLGWGGCKRRQLRRLLEFYSSHEIPTISWINPTFNYVCGIDRKQIEHVLDFLLHENRASNKIIIHLHSNNGALAWSYMLDIMRTNEHYHQLLGNIKGIIFDSAPFMRLKNTPGWLISSAIGVSRACVAVMLNRPQYFHLILSPMITYYLFLRFLYRRYFSSDPLSPSDKIREILNTTPIDIKQYYLYSDSDHFIPSSIIEYCMANQVKRGVQVMSHRFVDSEHVNHFRLHPVEYGKLILDFIVEIENDKFK